MCCGSKGNTLLNVSAALSSSSPCERWTVAPSLNSGCGSWGFWVVGFPPPDADACRSWFAGRFGALVLFLQPLQRDAAARLLGARSAARIRGLRPHSDQIIVVTAGERRAGVSSLRGDSTAPSGQVLHYLRDGVPLPSLGKLFCVLKQAWQAKPFAAAGRLPAVGLHYLLSLTKRGGRGEGRCPSCAVPGCCTGARAHRTPSGSKGIY